jgi:uncharacterized protein YhdP
MFREPVTLTVPACTVAIDWGRGWQADVSGCAIENEDLALHGDLLLSSNEGRPAIDLNAAVTRGRIGRLGPYWPESVLKDRLKSWLREALAGGEIAPAACRYAATWTTGRFATARVGSKRSRR